MDDLRKRYELPGKFFIYPAAAWPHKNHQRLIEAFELAAIEDSQLILTGGGHEEAAGSDNVRFFGRVSTEDLVGLYCLATALVFPSQYESWSIPIMEAMACGCPVASSNVTSLGEQVGAAGLLFDPTDISAMAKAMQVLAGSKFCVKPSPSGGGIEFGILSGEFRANCFAGLRVCAKRPFAQKGRREMFDLSIVIPTCNRAEFLRRNLASLRDVRCSFEVIVVDGASEDGTARRWLMPAEILGTG